MRNKHFIKSINLIRLNPLNYRHFAFLFILLNSILGVNNAIQAQCTPATQTFNYAGGVQDFVVPNSINRITFSVTGADGGDGGGSTGNGGSGGSINASFSVSSGDNIRLIVGQAGESKFWGGGGGGTAVINCGNPANCATGTLLIVAGGGGGGRGNNPGGGAAAVAGSGAAGSNDVGGGGGGGVNGGGGVSFDGAQASKTSISAGGLGGNVSNGGKGFGGGGALQSTPGGGGGGGYTGGNGTINFGYGGSNYVNASAIAGFNNTAGIDGGSGGNNTNGVVVLSYTCPDPCLAFTNNRAYVNAGVTSSGDGSSWAKAFKTLQEALTLNCSSITQIWVAKGTYTPTTTANRTISFVMKNGIAIYGGFKGDEATLSERNWVTNVTTLSGFIGGGERSYHVINNFYTSTNQLTSTAVLDGFTVTGGLATGSSTREDLGGGMHNEYASPTITNCIFTNNTAQFSGGGVANYRSSPNISYCDFTNNAALDFQGGGMFNYRSFFVGNWNPIVTHCTFTNNTAKLGGGGLSNRGAWLTSGGPSVSYCTFSNNTATQDLGYGGGGGMCNDSVKTTISHCTFIGNSATNGGGLYLGFFGLGASYCLFEGNSASERGGGVFAHSSDFTEKYVNCSFIGNTAKNGGGLLKFGVLKIANSSFSGNSATENGGGINTSFVNMLNCILWGNSSELFVVGTNTINIVAHSIIKQASGVYSGTGNLNVDPLFVNQPPIGLGTIGDLHLQNNSPV